jgi:hypothetical protein
MANEFIARNGLISQNNSVVTGSLTVTQGITGSLFGTSSWSVSSSLASTASFAQRGNGSFSGSFSGSGANLYGVTANENVVQFLSSSNLGTFGYAHGTITIGNKFFIGTREGATSKLLRFNGTVLEDSITIPCTADIGLESICKKSDDSRLYITRHYLGTSYIVSVNPNDFTDISYNVITGVNLTASPAICTDDTHIYGVEYGGPPCKFFKIAISGFTTTLTNNWTGVDNGHAITYNSASNLLYATATPGYFAKVNTSDLTYSQLNLTSVLSTLTDDLAFFPDYNNASLINFVVVGSEYISSTIPKGFALINVDNMTYQIFEMLPTYGLFTRLEEFQEVLYNCSNEGFIQKIGIDDLVYNLTVQQRLPTTTYECRFDNGVPNEMMFNSSGEIFITNWTSDAQLHKISLKEVNLPLATKEEVYYSILGGTAASSSYAITASFAQRGNGSFSGSFTGSFSGSLFGTSSWATNSLTSSFVTASNVFGPFGSSSIASASFATTSSYALNGGVTNIIAGTNITISSATGAVTINSTGGGGGGTDLGLVQAMTLGLQNIF